MLGCAACWVKGLLQRKGKLLLLFAGGCLLIAHLLWCPHVEQLKSYFVNVAGGITSRRT